MYNKNQLLAFKEEIVASLGDEAVRSVEYDTAIAWHNAKGDMFTLLSSGKWQVKYRDGGSDRFPNFALTSGECFDDLYAHLTILV